MVGVGLRSALERNVNTRVTTTSVILQTTVTDALQRTPPGENARITVTADPAAAPGVVRLLVDGGGTVVACALPAVEQMAANPS